MPDQVIKCECGAYAIKHEHSLWIKCSYCGKLVYLDSDFGGLNTDIQFQIIDKGSCQDGEWIRVKDLNTGEIDTYWKEEQ